MRSRPSFVAFYRRENVLGLTAERTNPCQVQDRSWRGAGGAEPPVGLGETQQTLEKLSTNTSQEKNRAASRSKSSQPLVVDAG